MRIDNLMVDKMKREDVYILHEERVYMREAGDELSYYSKQSGGKPVKISRNNIDLTNALIYGTEITKEEYEKF